MACSVVRARDAGEAWSWRLPPRRFGRLTQVERVQLERAENLFRGGKYEAAAVEFEQFDLQFPRSSLRAHVLLMRAYSLHRARHRNRAIDLYTRLLDIYGNEVEEAAPAMFLMGNAHIQNGDVERGIEVLSRLADHDVYQEHPVADVAMNQAADYYAGRGEEQIAERYWRRVLDLYEEAFMRPEEAAKEARQRLADLYIRTRRYPALESALLRGSRDDAKCRETALMVYDRARRMASSLDSRAAGEFLSWFQGKRRCFTEGEELDDFLARALRFAVLVEDRRAFAGLRKDFEDTGNMDVYFNEALGFFGALRDRRAVAGILTEVFRYADGLQGEAFDGAVSWVAARMAELSERDLAGEGEWENLQNKILEKLAEREAPERLRVYLAVLERVGPAISNPAARVFWETLLTRAANRYRESPPARRNAGLAGLVDIAVAAGQYDRALDIAASMDDRPLATWKKVEVHQKQERWAAAAAACAELEEMDNTELALRALRTRADLYHKRLSRYEEAIGLYRQINDPPGTVWAIVDCYIRWGRPSDADRKLTEIENFFEDQAPAAAWRRARMWEDFENRDRMVAAARDVLRLYPEHRVSSQAHQLLNRHGVEIVGGGLMEAED